MPKKGEHKKTKKKPSQLSHMGLWRRKNSKKYQSWRKSYNQTKKSNSRNKARRLLMNTKRVRKCSKCGISPSNPRLLEVHHKDGNMYNNMLTNLEWRCSKCNPRGRNA